MNTYLFNKHIYKVTEKEGTTTSLDEIRDKNDSKHNAVAVVDIEQMVSPAPDNKPELKDKLLVTEFGRVYGSNFLVQGENIDPNLYQVVGIEEKKIAEIYDAFNNNIRLFVPYAVTIRALIKEIGYLNDKKTVIFIDDLKDEILITIFEGLKFTKTRKITIEDDKQLVSEIKRSQKNYLNLINKYVKNVDEIDFYIVSNNFAYLNRIIDAKIVSTTKTFFIEEQYCFAKGILKTEKTLHFSLPQQIYKEKKVQKIKDLMKIAIISAGSLCFIGLLWVGFFVSVKLCQKQLTNLIVKKQQSQNALEKTAKQKYRSILLDENKLSFGAVYYSLLNVLPSSYAVDSYLFQKGTKNKWHADIYVYLAKEQEVYDDIKPVKMFDNFNIKNLFVNQKVGKHISFDIKG